MSDNSVVFLSVSGDVRLVTLTLSELEHGKNTTFVFQKSLILHSGSHDFLLVL